MLLLCLHISSTFLKFSSNPRLDLCFWRSSLSSTNIISIPNLSSSCSQSHILHDSDVSWKVVCWHILNIRKWKPWGFVPRPTSPFDEEQRLRSRFLSKITTQRHDWLDLPMIINDSFRIPTYLSNLWDCHRVLLDNYDVLSFRRCPSNCLHWYLCFKAWESNIWLS